MKSLIQIVIVCGIISLTFTAECTGDTSNPSLENCNSATPAANEKCCFVDGPKPSCQSYKADSYQSLKEDFNAKFNQMIATNIEQVHCGIPDQACLYLVLDEKARSKCTDKDEAYHSANNKCCFVTVGYKYNYSYFCYPAPKADEKKLKELTDAMKNEYFGANYVSIDCFTSFITSSLLSIALCISALLI